MKYLGPIFEKRITTKTQLSYDDAKAYADEYGLEYIETCAKTGENVDKAFHMIGGQALKCYKLRNNKPKHVDTKRSKRNKSKFNECVVL